MTAVSARRRHVLGDSYVDRALTKVNDFNREFQRLVTEYCWGEVWGDETLSPRERSMLTLGMVAALGKMGEFANHVRGARVNGLTPHELSAVLVQIAIYCGIPVGADCFQVAEGILSESQTRARLHSCLTTSPGPAPSPTPSPTSRTSMLSPAPRVPRHLVLVMNVFPYAGPSVVFSDAVIYRLRVRSASIAPDGHGFNAGAEEFTFDFTFDVPVSSGNGAPQVQRGRCATPSGEVIPFVVNDEKGGEGEGMQVFAGQRSDPFFLDGPMIEKSLVTKQLSFKKVGSDRLYGKNVLGIVLKMEWATVLKGGPLFAVVGETLTSGKRQMRLERVGRPEIKNVTLSAKMFDQLNRNLEIRELYNLEDAFNLSKTYLDAFRARFNANLAFFDSLDGKSDWTLGEHGEHPLTELLLADFLIVDVSKPFNEGSYFEIEQAVLKGRAHTTCGGRWLNQDIVDFILTLYINAGSGPNISDGVDAPIAWSSKAFPYMAPPNLPKVVVS